MAEPAAEPPRTAAMGRGAGHYFEPDPQSASEPQTVAVNIGEMQLRFVTDRGVFSPGRLDPGTRLLLLEAPPITATEKRILDLGCGWGAIACVTGLRSPGAEVVAVDVNKRALDLAARNAAASGAANVRVALPDQLDPEERFDRILSNPPIRVGKVALRELLAAWLDRLNPEGRAHVVVHRHLGSDSLARWLTDRGHHVTRLLSRQGYRILEVRASAVEAP